MAKNERPRQIAERFGKSVEWAKQHVGFHQCVDGLHYQASCLVRDPEFDAEARLHMSKRGELS